MITPNLGKIKILVPEPATGQGRDINFNFRVIAGEIDLLDAHLENISNPHQTTLEQILSQSNSAASNRITNLSDGQDDQDAVTKKQLEELRDYIDEQIEALSLGTSSGSSASSSSASSSSSSGSSSSSSG